ncbi:MAG: hypothetical protein HQ579_03915 [Candidatus Omnitrophica bacterium]|nr:hypothetical protein [Candidatus Omnitrophota bacterium]
MKRPKNKAYFKKTTPLLKRKYRQKTERQLLILENDRIFREIIRKRDVVCQKTGKARNLQVAHYFTRGNLRTRWDEDNACLMNAGAHLYWAHTEIEQFRDWWIKRLGIKRFEQLKLRAGYISSYPTHEIKAMKERLKERLSEL